GGPLHNGRRHRPVPRGQGRLAARPPDPGLRRLPPEDSGRSDDQVRRHVGHRPGRGLDRRGQLHGHSCHAGHHRRPQRLRGQGARRLGIQGLVGTILDFGFGILDSRASSESRVRSRKSRSSESGYTMVAIVIGMMIMAILLMAVAPSIGTIMKREREQELLFRGKQYARAIALFQKRYGRLPTELKELYENRPRPTRRLLKEPMCNAPDWHVIYQGSPDAIAGGQPPAPGGQGGPTNLGKPLPTPSPGVFGPSGETKTVGPIIGVRSTLH